jgi:DNA (cytosine-5)-methyltransferase 1
MTWIAGTFAVSSVDTQISAVDLFAGAGGLSTGMVAAGAKIILAVEAKADAASTYRLNHSEVNVVNEIIDSEWRAELNAIPDLVAGGPPCQGWSTLGQRGAPERRALQKAALNLFLQQVELLHPRAVLLENVRGLAMAEGGARLEAVEEKLEALGYDVKSALVRACDFGVPQLRHRLFVVGVLRSEDFVYQFPKSINDNPPSFMDAVGDLPALGHGEASSTYKGTAVTSLQAQLRGEEEILRLHEAPRHPDHILSLLEALPIEGGGIRDLPPHLKPGSGFHNTYARLRSSEPAPAVTSSIGRISSGRHVHPTQNRALTPREAARLQTFPDSYKWHGRRWSVYEQIGNAVPPVLAEQIALPLVRGLSGRGASSWKSSQDKFTLVA